MKRKFLVWTGSYYSPKYLTQNEICCIIKKKHTEPVLNSQGEMLTCDDLDFGEEL